MKKIYAIIGYVCLIIAVIAITVYGIIGIYDNMSAKPLQTIPEVNPKTQPLIREVYATYDSIGIVIDEYGYLWEWDTDLMGDRTIVKLWINDCGTPNDVTDDVIIDYSGW